jgi:pyrimidine oxygenase
MDMGVFIPIGNNGWLISTESPQYMPSFELNKEIVLAAESYGMDFALSMIKLRGFGGESEFWDYNLESFTLMSGLAAVTERIKLYASSAVLTLPPALVARMMTTLDSIAPGRVGVNIVSGWAPGEYTQMGIWPGNDYYGYRYDYCGEYVQVLKELWGDGKSDLKGKYFTMEDCHMLPKPSTSIPIVAAGQSASGMKFGAQYADYNFCMGVGVNTPTAHADQNRMLIDAAAETGRDVGAYILFMVIADETDELAMAKWKKYNDGADMGALAWMSDQASNDASADSSSTAKTIALPEGAVNFNMGTLVGSYETIARMLDEAALVPGTKGIMMTFDDFVGGVHDFGSKIQPLMACRADRVAASAA